MYSPEPICFHFDTPPEIDLNHLCGVVQKMNDREHPISGYYRCDGKLHQIRWTIHTISEFCGLSLPDTVDRARANKIYDCLAVGHIFTFRKNRDETVELIPVAHSMHVKTFFGETEIVEHFQI